MDEKQRGYLTEIFSSYQGEGGSIEGSCQGKRQIFIRFAGCNIAMKDFDTPGCVWCDTPYAKNPTQKEFTVEKEAGTGNFKKLDNPVQTGEVIDIVKYLKTPDLHSISFTGGEPLCQVAFLKNLAGRLKDTGYSLYLETNGSLVEETKIVGNLFDYACVDIKDESSKAAMDWRSLVKKEFETIRLLKKNNVKVFGKVVVTEDTHIQNIKWYAQELNNIGVSLAIQAVTPHGPIKAAVSIKRIFEFTKAAAEYLPPDMLTFSFQAHKAMGVL
ncbi:MAG: 7-carboxy-7-deazaguanine synthase QueE [Candidatus Hydrothermarchaeales archaeon]